MSKIEFALNTVEIAEMLDNTPHKDILKKLEGRTQKNGKHIKGYIEILTERQMSPSDFFIPSTYKDSSGKENKCYKVTKKGCEFLANKFTGAKGVEFTARYINRFHEMETALQNQNKPSLPEDSLAGIGRILEVMEHTMTTQAADPRDTAKVMKSMLNQFGIRVPREFTSTRPALGRCGGGRKDDIIRLIGKIDDSVFLFRIYVSLREYIKEKEAQA